MVHQDSLLVILVKLVDRLPMPLLLQSEERDDPTFTQIACS